LCNVKMKKRGIQGDGPPLSLTLRWSLSPGGRARQAPQRGLSLIYTTEPGGAGSRSEHTIEGLGFSGNGAGYAIIWEQAGDSRGRRVVKTPENWAKKPQWLHP